MRLGLGAWHCIVVLQFPVLFSYARFVRLLRLAPLKQQRVDGNNSCCLYGNKCQASFRQRHQQRKLIFLNASMVACGDGRWQLLLLSFLPLNVAFAAPHPSWGLELRIVFLITVKHSSETRPTPAARQLSPGYTQICSSLSLSPDPSPVQILSKVWRGAAQRQKTAIKCNYLSAEAELLNKQSDFHGFYWTKLRPKQFIRVFIAKGFSSAEVAKQGKMFLYIRKLFKV